MDKLMSGPLGVLLVIAQAGFFIYLMRGLFLATRDDAMGATSSAKRWRRSNERTPFERRPHPDASDEGSVGWKKTGRTLETYYNEVSGAMTGRVLSGLFAGKRLEDLSRTDCMRLHEFSRAEDPEAAEFIAAYMHRRFAGGGPTGFDKRQKREAPPPPPPSAEEGPMTTERAYALLGLEFGAREADIHRAHRALIKKYHPDHGGSHEKAALINQAKDVLLKD